MDVQRGHVPLMWQRRGPTPQQLRYELLEEMHRACRRHGASLLAFGFDDDGLRAVVEGPAARLRSVWASAWFEATNRRMRRVQCPGRAVASHTLVDAVVWAHVGPLEADEELSGPLETPWSSHRDLLGFRRAPFYDPSVLDGRVDPQQVHERCGGGPAPSADEMRRDCCYVRYARYGRGPREPLLHLSHVAGSVLGREPADPKCFGLFAQLARSRGWTVREVADSLLVSSRRVRQLCDEQARELGIAYTALFHPESVGRLP